MDIQTVYKDLFSDRKKKIIIDSDAYNEIDDQFAVAYALLSKERVEVLSLNAAPFLNWRSVSAGDGMEKSYRELQKISALTDETRHIPVYKGSDSFLKDKRTPVYSAAAENIIETAKKTQGEPLYVVAIGAITNVASALLIAPEIAEKIVVVWLGCNKRDWKNNEEFNLIQDVFAAQAVLESDVPFVHVPCMGLASMFISSLPEIKACLQGRNSLCDYLIQTTQEYAQVESGGNLFGYSKIIWDVLAIAVFTKPEAMEMRIIKNFHLTDDKKPIEQPGGKDILVVEYAYRDPIYIDCFKKLANLD